MPKVLLMHNCPLTVLNYICLSERLRNGFTGFYKCNSFTSPSIRILLDVYKLDNRVKSKHTCNYHVHLLGTRCVTRSD